MKINGGGMKMYNPKLQLANLLDESYQSQSYFQREQQITSSLHYSTENTTEKLPVYRIHSYQASQEQHQIKPQLKYLPSIRPTKQLNKNDSPKKQKNQVPMVDNSVQLERDNSKIDIDPKVKRALSLQTKNNFLQFLLIQKAGQPGDYQFFEKINRLYKKELFGENYEQYKKKARRKKKLQKTNIAYLKLEDENEDALNKQIDSIIRNSPQKHLPRGLTPLDHFIKELHEPKIPQYSQKIQLQDQGSSIDKFQI